MNVPADLNRAHTLLREGKLQAAEAICRQALASFPDNAPSLHLLGLVRERAGDVVEAERLMRESVRLAPQNAEFQLNLATLLRSLQRPREAEAIYRQVLKVLPGHRSTQFALARSLDEQSRFSESEALYRAQLVRQSQDAPMWSALAMNLRSQHRLLEAEASERRAIGCDPKYGLAHHNLGSLLSMQERAEEALAALECARALGIRGFELEFNLGRTLTQLYRLDEAEAAFGEAVALQPRHAEAQLNLARLRYLRGDPHYSREIAQAAATYRSDVALQLVFGGVLSRAGDHLGAETLLRQGIAATQGAPELRSALARTLLEVGRLAEAESEALEAATLRPHDAEIVDNLVTTLLCRGRPQDALPFIRAQRTRQPHGQHWIAHQATAARMMGQPEYLELCDYARWVVIYDLDPPPGWRSAQEFNAALANALNALHPFARHPLDQSLRNGSQTARSLVMENNEIIQAAMHSFEAPIADYRRGVGTDPAHPFTARNYGTAAIVGAWSVRLHREGFHVNHVHPQGWISSAYYVSVPPEVDDQDLQSGWLKFGEPRFPTPGVTADCVVQPRVGRLVLFPSYMWHGTNPIHGAESRLTIAFDAVARA